MREFVEKCLATVSLRLSARELLEDPFLRVDDSDSDFRSIAREVDDLVRIAKGPYLHHSGSPFSNDKDYANGYGYLLQNECGHPVVEFESCGIELFEYHDDEHDNEQFASVDISLKGKRREDGSVYLRLRIADKEGWKPSPRFLEPNFQETSWISVDFLKS